MRVAHGNNEVSALPAPLHGETELTPNSFGDASLSSDGNTKATTINILRAFVQGSRQLAHDMEKLCPHS